MMELKKIQKEEVCRCIKRMYTLKPQYSNYFNQPLEDEDLYYETDHSFVLLKNVDGKYSRIYLLSDEFNDISIILKNLKGVNVINIPSKGDIADWEKLMTFSGFRKIGVYERFYNTNIKKRGSLENICYAMPERERDVYKLLHDHFLSYVDYLPSHAELSELIEKKQVLVNYDEGAVCGTFIFELEGRKCYFRAWIDHGRNGLKLLFDVYNIMCEKEKSYAYFWVNSTNENVKSIHRLLGAQPDNLKDFTFIKE